MMLTFIKPLIIGISASLISGCVSTRSIALKDDTGWNEKRAFAVINRAKEINVEHMRRSRVNFLSFTGCEPDMSDVELAKMATASGLMCAKVISTGTTYQDSNLLLTPVRSQIERIPLARIESVSLKKQTNPNWLSWIILPGLFTPLFDDYSVDVCLDNKSLNYVIPTSCHSSFADERFIVPVGDAPIHEDGKYWSFFPFWLLRPLHFVDNTNRVAYTQNRELAEAFEYLRVHASSLSSYKPTTAQRDPATLRYPNAKKSQSAVAAPASSHPPSLAVKSVAPYFSEATKVKLTEAEALSVIRESLEKTGTLLLKDIKGGAFSVDRVDRLGFAFTTTVLQKQGNITLNASIPKSVRFSDVTRLGISLSESEKEKGICLMNEKDTLWEMPFEGPDGRTKLLSALATVCENLSTGAALQPENERDH